MYQFTNSNNSINVNERFTAYDFANFMTDVGDTNGSGPIPDSVDRTTSPGRTVGFNYLGPDGIQPGETTGLLVIETDATGWGSGFVSAQDGTASYADAIAPASAIPEPGTLVMLGTGILGMAGLMRRKMR